jgi:hypothetical protein
MECELKFAPEPDIGLNQVEVKLKFGYLIHIGVADEILIIKVNNKLGEAYFPEFDEFVDILLMAILHF